MPGKKHSQAEANVQLSQEARWRLLVRNHTYINVALMLGGNQKWIAEQTGTSIAMIQEHYGKYIRDDGDALLRAYVEAVNDGKIEERSGTFAGTFSSDLPNYRNDLASPTGFEPVLPA